MKPSNCNFEDYHRAAKLTVSQAIDELVTKAAEELGRQAGLSFTENLGVES